MAAYEGLQQAGLIVQRKVKGREKSAFRLEGASHKVLT
jgi:hypothetical protein